VALAAGLAGIAVAALATAAWIPGVVFGVAALVCGWHETADCARAAGDIRRAVPQAGDD
jgi:hypothetical protein